MRLAFQLDTNDNSGADIVSFYSGDYVEQQARPHLLIEYFVPDGNNKIRVRHELGFYLL